MQLSHASSLALAAILIMPKHKKKWILVYVLFLLKKYIVAKKSSVKHKVKEYPFIGTDPSKLAAFNRCIGQEILKDAKLNDWKTFEYHLLGGMDWVFLMDPADRKFMLKDNWKAFAKNVDGTGFGDFFKEVMGDGIFAVDGSKWQDHRKSAVHLFSTNQLRTKTEHVFQKHAHKLVSVLTRCADSGQVVDLQNLLSSYTFDSFSEIAFGIDPKALDEAADGKKLPFLSAFDNAQLHSGNRLADIELIWKFKRFFKLGSEAQLAKDLEILDGFVFPIVEKRLKDVGHETQHDDLLSLFINYGKTKNRPYMLKKKYLRDVILNFMIAGRDTTACATTNALRLLSEADQPRTRVIEELGKLKPTMDGLANAQYTDACFNETLRMFPPVPGDFRYATKDVTMPSGLEVKKHYLLSIPNWSIGRNPHQYENPDVFNPERWFEINKGANITKLDEYEFPVFWGGPRLCLGKHMARYEAKVVLKELLTKFRITVHESFREEFTNAPVLFYRHGLPVTVKQGTSS